MPRIEDLHRAVPRTASPVYAPTDPCPCESGATVADCRCLLDGIAGARTASAGIVGYQHPGCYARRLSDCSSKLSLEHYLVPHKVLRRGDAKKVVIVGHEWQRQPVMSVGTNALGAKVLCKAHNERLHTLDDQFSRLHEHVSASASYLASGRSREYLFNGHDIERWLLKALCGWVAARGIHRSFEISERWLRIIFGEEPMPRNRGLFFRVSGLATPPTTPDHPGVPAHLNRNGMSFMPLIKTHRNPQLGARYVSEYIGCEIGFNGLRLTLSMKGRQGVDVRADEPRPIWRPKEVRWYQDHQPAVLSLRFDWSQGGSSSVVGMRTELHGAAARSAQ